MLPSSLAIRLATQLEALPIVLGGASAETLMARPPSGKWSAHENLAHLARHHAIMIERLRRILVEDGPQLARYRAEDDPEWPRWAALSTAEVLHRIADLRRELTSVVEDISEEQLDRVGIHPTLGALTIPTWIEFFLLHEAHHLYVTMGRVRGA
jgi:hypothetical protein